MITKEQVRERAKLLAQPIDFDALVSQGLLKKEGARYRVWNIHKLPHHVGARIREREITKGVPGVLVKFELPSPAQLKKLAAMAQI